MKHGHALAFGRCRNDEVRYRQAMESAACQQALNFDGALEYRFGQLDAAVGEFPTHSHVGPRYYWRNAIRLWAMNEKTLILAIGDIHLGTACSGIPSAISEQGVDPKELTPAAALRSAVDLAIERQVAAVLFAGDVVESANARFEALPPLEEGVQRLLKAGVEVVAVAGNHDVEALPRLANLIDGFTLLGKGGCWEDFMLSRAGAPQVQVVGWSFGEKRVRQSPVAQLLKELPPPAAVPRIGLLHCDLGASGGNYAPVRQTELDDANFDAWLLGHIHKPSLDARGSGPRPRPCGYLGSLAALDPSETGPHGPWLVEVSGDGGIKVEQVPLAPVRWESIEVSVGGIENIEDVCDRLLDEAKKFAQEMGRGGRMPAALGLRVKLTGSPTAYEDIRRWIENPKREILARFEDGAMVFINKVSDAMELALDMHEIASGDDPAALLAKNLLLLSEGNDQSRELLALAREQLEAIAGQAVWSPVAEHRNASDPLSDDALRDILLRSGKAALSAMTASLAEREPQ